MSPFGPDMPVVARILIAWIRLLTSICASFQKYPCSAKSYNTFKSVFNALYLISYLRHISRHFPPFYVHSEWPTLPAGPCPVRTCGRRTSGSSRSKVSSSSRFQASLSSKKEWGKSRCNRTPVNLKWNCTCKLYTFTLVNGLKLPVYLRILAVGRSRACLSLPWLVSNQSRHTLCR